MLLEAGKKGEEPTRERERAWARKIEDITF
jgi:hypothetical protein